MQETEELTVVIPDMPPGGMNELILVLIGIVSAHNTSFRYLIATLVKHRMLGAAISLECMFKDFQDLIAREVLGVEPNKSRSGFQNN